MVHKFYSKLGVLRMDSMSNVIIPSGILQTKRYLSQTFFMIFPPIKAQYLFDLIIHFHSKEKMATSFATNNNAIDSLSSVSRGTSSSNSKSQTQWTQTTHSTATAKSQRPLPTPEQPQIQQQPQATLMSQLGLGYGRRKEYEEEHEHKEAKSPRPSNEKINEVEKDVEAIAQLGVASAVDSTRSVRQRVPWPKKGILRRFIHLTHVISLSNMISFPRYCARHGGVAFFIAFLIAYIFVAIPLLCLEMALGQFSSIPPVELFRKMSPSLASIGVAMLALLVFKSLHYAAIATQAFWAAILTVAEGIRPAWNNCSFANADDKRCFQHDFTNCYRMLERAEVEGLNKTNFDANCQKWVQGLAYIMDNKLNNKSGEHWQYWRPPHLDYMAENVYKPIFHLNKWNVSPPILLISALVWILTGVLSNVAINKLGKIFVLLIIVIGILGDMVLSIIFAPGKGEWTAFFAMDDLSALGSLEIWADATRHVLSSLNLGLGAVHKISNLADFKSNFLADAMLTATMDILLSLVTGVTFLSATSAVAHELYPGDELKHRIRFLLTNDYLSAFTMFPEHMSWHMPSVGWIFGALHYLKLALIVIPGTVVSFGIVKFAFEETILNLRAKHGSPKEEGKTETKTVLISSILLVTISFAVSVVLVGPSGFMLSKLWNEFCGVSLMFVCLCEIWAISYHYGFRRYLANVKTMLRLDKAHMSYMLSSIVHYVVTPALIIIAIGFKVASNRLSRVVDYSFPVEFEAYGWLIFVLTIVTILIPLLRYLFISVKEGRFMDHVFDIRPTWGPINESNFQKNLLNEMRK